MVSLALPVPKGSPCTQKLLQDPPLVALTSMDLQKVSLHVMWGQKAQVLPTSAILTFLRPKELSDATKISLDEHHSLDG